MKVWHNTLYQPQAHNGTTCHLFSFILVALFVSRALRFLHDAYNTLFSCVNNAFNVISPFSKSFTFLQNCVHTLKCSSLEQRLKTKHEKVTFPKWKRGKIVWTQCFKLNFSVSMRNFVSIRPLWRGARAPIPFCALILLIRQEISSSFNSDSGLSTSNDARLWPSPLPLWSNLFNHNLIPSFGSTAFHQSSSRHLPDDRTAADSVFCYYTWRSLFNNLVI